VRSPGARARALGVNLLVLGAALLLPLGVLECALRAFPERLLPAGSYGAGAYSPELGLNVHRGTAYYNKLRFVERRANADGFMDVEHAREKPPGTLRVGFFGDSYVEALQVPLDATFFRRLPERVAGRPLEPFAFGRSGWGAIHALTVWRTFGPRYQLDAVAYVFVENDPGDSDLVLQRALGRLTPAMLYAELSDEQPGFRVVQPHPGGRRPFPMNLVKLAQERSLLVQLAVNRVLLLREAGVQTRADAAQVEMTSRAGAVPDQNDAPSSWPPEHLGRVKELNRRILAAFQREVAAAGARFFVVYVPRGDRQLRGELAPADTFRAWLGETCRTLGIPLVDPTPELAARLAAGHAMYDDHFTREGHAVVAQVIARDLEGWAAAASAGP